MSNRLPLILLLVTLFLQSADACQVPVFRYALERWEADTFRLQVVHRDPLPAGLKTRLDTLAEQLTNAPPPTNLELEILDASNLTEAQQLSTVGLERVTSYPAILLHPPESWAGTPPLVLDATTTTVDQVLQSPARQRCVDALIAGESTVWLLVESGDPDTDNAALKRLQQGLEAARAEIELPEGVIRQEDIGNIGNEVNLDDVLRSSIPLKISFKIERLNRTDPAEQIFLQLLTGPTGVNTTEPLLIPIFGRGRTPGPVPAAAVTPQRIVQACAYLCGACSCQVKSGNPGYDLLFTAAWHDHLQDGLVVIDKALPPLTGIGELTQKPTPEPATAPKQPTPPEPASKLWWIAAATLAVALITGSLLLTRSSPK